MRELIIVVPIAFLIALLPPKLPAEQSPQSEQNSQTNAKAAKSEGREKKLLQAPKSMSLPCKDLKRI